MTRLLTSNTDLSGRMRRLEDVFDARGNSESLPDYLTSQDPSSTGTAPAAPTHPPTAEVGHPPRTQAWSAFTGYTLSDTPVLSIIALPVVANELRDGHAYYTFDFARRFNGDIAQLAPEPGQNSTKKLAAVLRQPRTDGKLWLGLASTVRRLNRKKRKTRQL